jgi:CubicO group peptidase (beta-lactamase class C family)
LERFWNAEPISLNTMKRLIVILWLLLPTTSALNFNAAADYSSARRGQAVLVWQTGREVYAQAQNGFDLESPHILASGSKSFACAIAIAAQDDSLLTLDEPVAQTLPEWRGDPRKAKVTIRQLLSFTSGLSENAADSRETSNVDNLNLRAMALPLEAEPGLRYTYNNAHLAVFNEVVRRKTGKLTDAYLMERVLAPIGVTGLTWTRDRVGNAQLAGGGKLDARGWAKYGQLMLQGGVWNGKQILSSAGLQQCLRGSSALAVYGLTWWLNQDVAGTIDRTDVIPVRGFGLPNLKDFERFSKSAPTDLFMAAGAYNQRMYIVPSLQLVVVRFGAGGEWLDEDFLRLLLD